MFFVMGVYRGLNKSMIPPRPLRCKGKVFTVGMKKGY
ncbi:hypothetical protein I656_03454 [Geobacillus sp. WSUCF1]|nr:hypothetical protein I656_03454 [Geobacillus sp. WSUCF1]